MSSIVEHSRTGKSLPRLLRPGIMALLAQGGAHGYQIAQCLSSMRMFAGREPDHPGIYRALRDMVDEGLVTMSWETSEVGPARKVFALTRAGENCLNNWLTTLGDYRDAINELLALLRQGKREYSKLEL